jgi:predicted phage terminase large subunit-like protein
MKSIAANQSETEDKVQKLCDSLLYFIQIFYYIRTGRKFDIGNKPVGQSHFELIVKAFERVFDGKCTRLIIAVPPRYAKTEIAIHFLAWAFAQYPDSQNIFVSYSHTLAKKATQTVREIIQMSEFRELFHVSLKEGSTEKSNFELEDGGALFGVGSGGGLTGRGAGLKNVLRFGGCIIIDDIIKPEDALSDTVRESTNEWFYNTLQSRTNSPRTPIILIGQRTHEDDLAARLIETGEWELLSLPALDSAGNALYPEMHDVKTLLKMQKESPWVFAAQYQQDPVAGGATLFNPNWFVQLDEEPEIISSFITCDTAETDKAYNDATVFSFFGVYKITIRGTDVPDLYGLHWIDCLETRIEPKDLQSTFLDFYSGCMRHKCKPAFSIIEKKSTGTTLASVLKEIQGLRIIDVERTKASGSKAARYLEMQPYIANKLISLPLEGKHTSMCIKHMSKITVNMVHRFDDIADTLYDAIKIALIDKTVINSTVSKRDYTEVASTLLGNAARIDKLRTKAYSK